MKTPRELQDPMQMAAEAFAANESTVLELISTGASVEQALAALCQTVERQLPGMLTAVLRADATGTRLVVAAAPSLPAGCVAVMDGIAIGPQSIPCGVAAYRREMLIVRDIAADPQWESCREPALRNGVRACWSSPILSGRGALLGTFACLYSQPHAPTPEEVRSIERASQIARIAIERQIHEKALRDAEEQYRTMVEQAIPAIFRSTPDGVYVSVNSSLARMCGYASPEELIAAVRDIGKQEYVDPLRRAEFKRLIEQQGEVRNFEYEIRRKDGSHIWISESARGVRGPDGSIAYYEGFAEDITERRRSENERQAIFEIIKGVSATSNLDGLLRLIHQSISRVLYAENCFIALHDAKTGLFHFPFFVDQFDQPPPPQQLGKSCTVYVFRTGRPMSISQKEFDALVAQGEVELVGTPSPSWLGVPLRTPTETIGVLVVQHYSDENAYSSRDLEFLSSVGGQIAFAIERKQAEDALRAAENKFRALVEQLPAVTYIAEPGPAGRWEYVSPQIATLLGYTPHEWMEKPSTWLDRVHADDRERVLQAEREFERTGQPLRQEYRVHARDGRVLWFRDEATAVRRGANARPVMQGVLYDITDQKRLEDQLRQAQKMEAVGRLAGGVAHDFNNLLMVIQGHTSLLEERLPAGSSERRSLEHIQKSAERAASLTKQLLAFSRMQVMQPRVLDLNTVVADMGKMLRRLIGEDVELTLRYETHLGRVKADAGQIEQVLLNLVVNARDAMPTGGKLVIETSGLLLDETAARRFSGLKPGPYVVLSVSDTGMGMDQETQSHIFEPFFTTKDKGKGTGLGLATVYGIVQQSGGHITVYSQPGKGATFRIFLPQVDAPEDRGSGVRPRPALPKGTETILLAEDESEVRALARDALQRAGYAVLEAGDGEEACRLAESYHGKIDLLLTDVVMPVLGGPELALRLCAARPSLKVLFMSGYSEFTSGTNGQESVLGPNSEYLQKPFSLEMLGRRVREVLDEGAGTPRVPPSPAG
jgi:PAS domain S-box-containing protein